MTASTGLKISSYAIAMPGGPLLRTRRGPAGIPVTPWAAPAGIPATP